MRVLWPCAAASAVLLTTAGPDRRYVLAPLLAMATIVVWMLVRLWDVGGVLPVFEAGFLCAVATLAYSAIPLLNFMAGGNRFTVTSDGRLFRLDPTPLEAGSFAVRHVLYLFALCVVYVWARGKKSAGLVRMHPPTRATQIMIVILFGVFALYLLITTTRTGGVEGASYGEMISASLESRLPLVVRQINHYIQGMAFVFKLAVLIILMSRCRSKRWLSVVGLWLFAEVAFSSTRMGGRTGTALLVLAAGLLYHRLVRPVPLTVAVPGAVVFLAGFLAYGYIRDGGVEAIKGVDRETAVFSQSNEFQALFGTALDVLTMKELGSLNVPWQVRVNDIIGLFPPQQLLPFAKFDAATWYMTLIEDTPSGSGYMWGVVAQSIVGFDWVELAVRGAMLGLILARVHRWYIKRSARFLPNLFYLWLCLWSYYTFRDTTFSLLSRLIYEVTPAFLLILYAPVLLRRSKNTNGPQAGILRPQTRILAEQGS